MVHILSNFLMKITTLLFRIAIFTLLTRNFISCTILGRHAFDHHITNWRKWIYLNAWITRIFPQFSRRCFVIVVTDYLLHLFLSFCYLPPGEKSMSGYALHVLNDLFSRCRNFASVGISYMSWLFGCMLPTGVDTALGTQDLWLHVGNRFDGSSFRTKYFIRNDEHLFRFQLPASI